MIDDGRMTISFTPPSAPTVARCIADARALVEGEQFVAQARCVDALLDCLNAAVRVSVVDTVLEILSDIAHVKLVKAAEFSSALDFVQMSLQVDAAFDHLELMP